MFSLFSHCVSPKLLADFPALRTLWRVGDGDGWRAVREFSEDESVEALEDRMIWRVAGGEVARYVL